MASQSYLICPLSLIHPWMDVLPNSRCDSSLSSSGTLSSWLLLQSRVCRAAMKETSEGRLVSLFLLSRRVSSWDRNPAHKQFISGLLVYSVQVQLGYSSPNCPGRHFLVIFYSFFSRNFIIKSLQ